jgi:hypothetical protein
MNRPSWPLGILVILALPAYTAETPAESRVVKAVLQAEQTGDNLLAPGGWRPYEQGYRPDGSAMVCDNGSESHARRGVSQTVRLNQSRPEPIVATAASMAENVGGSPDSDYALYLDLMYTDGTPLWGQTAPFDVGTHGWQNRRVVVLPEKPIRDVTVHLLLRGHTGKASFRDATLHVVRAADGAAVFDGVPVVPRVPAAEGFFVRDVAAGSDFVRLERSALGLTLEVARTDQGNAAMFDVTLRDTTGKDRAVTLYYSVPIAPAGLRWFEDPRQTTDVSAGREYVHATSFRAGANGRLSKYPLGAVGDEKSGTALAIDMARPAFYRIGCHAATGELFLAYDLGLTPEKPTARVRFCRFAFDPAWGFRSALDRYYRLFPDAFRCRTPQQGLWMPFAAISKVPGWEDFGFRFKEGNDETAWDDAHGIITFRYTEPMTWWMAMTRDQPRTYEAALAEARKLADRGNREARAFLTSAYQDESGRYPARLLDTPWCNGAVWSINSMPGIAGEVTDFRNKWSPAVQEQLYGAGRRGDLDGEYIDSSEGYVTDELDFRREHFAAADTPLCFSLETRRPAIFRGLVAFEYVRALAADVHARGKLMMANGAPTRLCWLAPLLEVMGTETDWNPRRGWSPMSDAEMLYRRSLCKGKPYCFLMNTDFERFGPELVERYMKRSAAYGMFPGFFSHNASQGHYFTRPELYDRDRPLFKKYIPLCRRLAEAGWEPIPLARADDPHIRVERYGSRYLTLLNDSPESRTFTLRLTGGTHQFGRELLTQRPMAWQDGSTTLTLSAEDIAILDREAE